MDHNGTVARLDTTAGSLHIFDVESLVRIIAQLPPYRYPSRFDELDPKSIPGRPVLVDGFSAESWAAYARVKARVATNMCRVNGELKARLASILAKGSHSKGETLGEDPLCSVDPWANASIRPTDKATDRGDDCAAWRKWKSTMLVAESSMCPTTVCDEFSKLPAELEAADEVQGLCDFRIDSAEHLVARPFDVECLPTGSEPVLIAEPFVGKHHVIEYGLSERIVANDQEEDVDDGAKGKRAKSTQTWSRFASRVRLKNAAIHSRHGFNGCQGNVVNRGWCIFCDRLAPSDKTVGAPWDGLASRQFPETWLKG